MILCQALAPYVCGDGNGDNLANVTDAVFITADIFNGGPAPADSGDDNCDGLENITDAVYKVSFIFSGGNSPGDPEPTGSGDCLNDGSCHCSIRGCL